LRFLVLAEELEDAEAAGCEDFEETSRLLICGVPGELAAMLSASKKRG
jgi:hypothetical protein